MIAIVFSWLIIFLICSVYGHLFVSLYSSLVRQVEKYNCLDISLIGICVVSLIISIISLFAPINESVFCILATLAFGYMLLNRLFRKELYGSVRNYCKELSLFYIIIVAFIVASVLLITLWAPDDYDPAYYHYQNIVWNEHFSVVPGLANIEDRFGFNSNALLLYALFSFKFIFSDYIFALQSLFVVLLFLWVLSEINRNKGELCCIIILFALFLFVISLPSAISNTSTDVIPNLVAFYIIVRILLYSDSLKSSYLLYFIVPVTMVTFKVSSVFLCVLCLYLLILLIKGKEYRRLVVLLILSMCVVVPWLIRNVVVSGYLVYPMFEIDLFSCDWKVPLQTVENQRKYMAIVANERHWFRLLKTIKVIFTKGEFTLLEDYYYQAVIQIFVFLCGVQSLITLIAKKVQRKKISGHIYLVALIITSTLIYWFFSARDYRFAYGTLLAVIVFCSFVLFPNLKVNKLCANIGLSFIAVFVLCFSIKWVSQYYNKIVKYTELPVYRMLYTPYSVNDKLLEFDSSKLERYKINDNMVIYISRYYGGCSYTIFPTVAFFESDSKAQDIKTVEMRGDFLQDGFKTRNNN